MATNKKTQEEIRQENIEATVSSAQQFYNENKKTIWTVFCAVVVIGLGILAYYRFVWQPRVNEAMAQCYPCEISFQQEDWELALDGDDNTIGFAGVIEEYGSKAGSAVYLYAGICALRLERYEDALDYLKKYDGKEPVLAARALACQGDAYVGLEDYSAAAAAFHKAAAAADNDFAASYLLKEGLALRELGKGEEAVKCFETIKDKYPMSIEAYDIDKYITSTEE
jgi:tetratricopeptide (TPR) repeat protein